MRLTLLFVLVAVMCALLTSRAAGATVHQLSAFKEVQVCTPFSVLVTSGDNYSISVDADPSVRRAIKASTSGDQLTLETRGNFRTQKPIKVTVKLPKGKLEGVTTNSPFTAAAKIQGDVAADGLQVTAGGAGSVVLSTLDLNRLSIIKNGAGTVVASGRADSVVVTGSGVGTVYLKGTIKDAEVTLSGVTNAAIDSTDGGLEIRGDLKQLSKVQYTQGTCDVQSDSPFGGGFPFGGLNMGSMFSGCEQVASINTPSPAQWTAGIDVSGSFTCAGEHGGSSSSSGGSGGSSSSSGGGSSSSSGGGSSSSSGGGSASASGSASSWSGNGANGVSYTSTGGRGGDGGSVYASSDGNTVVYSGQPGQDGGSFSTGGNGQSFQGNDGGVRTIHSSAKPSDLVMS